MKAIGMIRGKEGVHLLDVPKPRIEKTDEVLIRVKEAGIDGTDFGMLRNNLQDIAEGHSQIVMGHEMVGVVEEVGSEVKELAPGDTVVTTVRRGCGICQPCLHNQSDMCMTGLYTERGIHKRDGFFTKHIVDQEQYIIKVDQQIAGLAVFTEPLSIAEKGVDQIKLIQSRMPWACSHPEHDFNSPDWGGCKTALVIGAGPLGLLATAVLRLAEINVLTSDILPESSKKAQLVKKMGARYIDARNKTPREVAGICCQEGSNLDIIFEAAGAAAAAVEMINYMSRSSIYVMTGIPRKELVMKLDAAQLVRQIVRYNQVIVGSVNSNRSHFEMALKDIPEINSRFGGILNAMLTHHYEMAEYQKAFQTGGDEHIKTVLEIDNENR